MNDEHLVRPDFVCASLRSFNIVINSIVSTKKDFLSRNQVHSFLKQNCYQFLESFGHYFRSGSKHTRYNEKFARILNRCRQSEFFKDIDFIIDSGGYQISIGLLNKNDANKLMDLYYQYLVDYKTTYQKAFILDVSPGDSCKVFETFDEIFEMNMKSYSIAKSFPDDIRQKIIYVHHFRTPELLRTFNRILDEGDMFDKFEYHAAGGMVASMSSDIIIPCIIYTIPLVILINRAMKCGRDYLNFHILGGANHRDILFYELMKIHLKRVHNFNLSITYDSSGVFKALMISRYMFVINEDDSISKLDIRSVNLDKRYGDSGKTVIEMFKRSISDMVKKYDLKDIDMGNDIYKPNGGTFLSEIQVYVTFYALYEMFEAQKLLTRLSHDIYKFYANGDIDGFNRVLEETTRNINGGKITKKQKAKSFSMINTLNMLTKLDEDYCGHLVDKFLSKDEFGFLINKYEKGMILDF